MASPFYGKSCKKCGKAIQEAFVFLEETDELDAEDLTAIVSDSSDSAESSPVVPSNNPSHTKPLNRSWTIKKEPNSSTKTTNTEFASFNSLIRQKEKFSLLISRGLERSTEDFWRDFCVNCSTLLEIELDAQIKIAEQDKTTYLNYLQDIKNTPTPKTETILNDIDKHHESEESLRKFIQKLETERSRLEDELKHALQEQQLLDDQEQHYWNTFHKQQLNKLNSSDQLETLTMRKFYAECELKHLETRNVYQDAFYIDTTKLIGSINTFRFGRLPTESVNWEEINAAWGQATLLLYIIAKHVNFEFSRPKGSRSAIKNKKSEEEKDLFGSDDLGFGSWFWGFGGKTTNKFDEGMVAFLDCLYEISDYAKQKSKISVPFVIQHDKIDDMSIRVQSNSEENWTKALKSVLINLNILLAWLSGHP